MLNLGQFDNIYPNNKNAITLHFEFTEEGYLSIMSNESTDGELIKDYVENGNNKSFEILFLRHYDLTYKRFLKHCRDPDNAADLTQQIWQKMLTGLKNYKDDGKFTSFLMSSSTNLLTDFWRRKGVKDRVISQSNFLETDDPVDIAQDNYTDTQKSVELREQIDYLTSKLIPALPCDQRLVFLLKHESEYWEKKQRLNWQHLAELNDIDERMAWKLFEETRNELLGQTNSGQDKIDLTCEANLIFLVWTQSQRPAKDQDFTWSYFSEILKIPENTLKTRYRAALKALASGLSE